MNSRERVTRAIEMRGPDRVPLTHATLPGAVWHFGAALDDLYRRYPSDVANVAVASEGEYGPEIGTPNPDSWGAAWVRYTDEHKGQVSHHPLASWDSLASFQPPDRASDSIIDGVKAQVAAEKGQTYTLADGDTLWQRMFYLHGYAATLEDLLVAPDRCADLRDMILRAMVRRVERLCAIKGLDGLHFRDDWGSQEALMINPEMWRIFFKPAYARIFAIVRNADKHVWFHSDGAIQSIIPDLIAMGAQVLNPQVALIGRETLSRLCAGKISIQADIDRQWLLPYGEPEEIRATVRGDIDAFGRYDGGYIGRAEAAGDVPLENLQAVLDETTRYQVTRSSGAQVG